MTFLDSEDAVPSRACPCCVNGPGMTEGKHEDYEVVFKVATARLLAATDADSAAVTIDRSGNPVLSIPLRRNIVSMFGPDGLRSRLYLLGLRGPVHLR